MIGKEACGGDLPGARAEHGSADGLCHGTAAEIGGANEEEMGASALREESIQHGVSARKVARTLPCQRWDPGLMIVLHLALASVSVVEEESSMLEFTDAPYEFYPARPNRFLMWFCREVNRRISLGKPQHRITEVEVRGQEHLEEARGRGGKRWLFLANHSTHSDPQILAEAQRQMGALSCYMAAYDVFLRGKLQAWVMQNTGCFSVNRDGNDSRAMREAMRLLTEDRFGLTIFPEGNVYLMNDRVTPLLDGAAFIGMKAQKQLGDEKPIFVIPVSIKATHVTDQREVIREKLGRLAKDIGGELDPSASMVQEIKRIGLTALERQLKQRGLMPQESDDGQVRAHLEHCAAMMIGRLEEKMSLSSRAHDALGDRVRKIRSRVHKIRTDSGAKADHQVAATWADEAMIALRVLSYAGDYLDEAPTMDRCGESVEKLLEDIYSEVQLPDGDRHAIVQINPPINLAEHLAAYDAGARQVVSTLTASFESTLQAGLDAIGKRNQHLGAQLF